MYMVFSKYKVSLPKKHVFQDLSIYIIQTPDLAPVTLREVLEALLPTDWDLRNGAVLVTGDMTTAGGDLEFMPPITAVSEASAATAAATADDSLDVAVLALYSAAGTC